MSLLSLCNHTIKTQRKTRTKDASGGISSAATWADQTTGIVCTVQPLKNPRILDALAKKNIVADYVAYMESIPTGLLVEDRVVYNSENYAVTGWEGDQGGRGKVSSIYLNKVRVS